MAARIGRAYKELTLQQLRSFCETARRGSMKAAAQALDLAHPTVWQQVHALERDLGVALIEPHGRGSRLTDDGRLLAQMADSLIAGMDALKRTFLEARARVRPRLTVATTQRTLVEDLPGVVVAFERQHPEVLLCFKEVATEDVVATVESGQADLGLSANPIPRPARPALRFEPVYELDLLLVTPRKHPLAARRHVRPRDLVGFPFVNAPGNLPDPVMQALLDRLGVFEVEPRRIEARYTATIRRYVELGFGIGLIVGLPPRKVQSTLHERSMSRHFGTIPVYLVSTDRAPHRPFIRRFAEIVRGTLKRWEAT